MIITKDRRQPSSGNIEDMENISNKKAKHTISLNVGDMAESSRGTKVYDTGDRYEGQLLDGIPHGQGTLQWGCGDRWTGQFKYGKIHGEGVYTSYSNGSRFQYQGFMTEGQFEGEGFCKWDDGAKYTGQFYRGSFEGHGTFVWQDLRSYVGQWKGGKRNGVGVFFEPDRSEMYRGDWQNDKKHGNDGKYSIGDHLHFHGCFRNDCPVKGKLLVTGRPVADATFDGHTPFGPDTKLTSVTIEPSEAAAAGLDAMMLKRELWTSKSDEEKIQNAGAGCNDHSGVVKLVAVDPASEEWSAVHSIFKPTSWASININSLRARGRGRKLKEIRGETVQIVSVERVENELLLQLFVAERNQVGRQCGGKLDPFRAERWAFHGPGPQRDGGCDPLLSIIEESFCPMLAGTRAGAAYGNGTYFARDSSFSHDYAQQGKDGIKTMILARIAVGQYTRGHCGMVQPPLVPGHTSRHFNSLVNDEANPSIFVLQDGTCAYPAYVIRYHRAYDHGSDRASNMPSIVEGCVMDLGREILETEVKEWFHTTFPTEPQTTRPTEPRTTCPTESQTTFPTEFQTTCPTESKSTCPTESVDGSRAASGFTSASGAATPGYGDNGPSDIVVIDLR